MGRYATPRLNLRWDRIDHLRVLKMLAWVVYTTDGVNNPVALERHVNALCEPVMRIVLGEQGVTLTTIREQALAEQGIAITATRLHQRADKTHRYDELNEFAQAVIDAHSVIAVQSTDHREEKVKAKDEVLNGASERGL